MSKASIQEYVDLAHRLADRAQQETVPRFLSPGVVDDKGADVFDPVTQADREAESAIRAMLERSVPKHGILGEEHGTKATDGEWIWVIDPIDGTRAFISGFPTWVTLIGLLERGAPRLGLIDAPAAGCRFVGVVGTNDVPSHATRLDAAGPTPLRVRACPTLRAATVSTTSPDLFPQGQARDAWEAVRQSSRLQRYGGDGLAYGLLAQGRIDAVVEVGLQPYDLVAVIAVVRAAGGIVTSFGGGDPLDDGTVIASGDARVHQEILAIFASSGW